MWWNGDITFTTSFIIYCNPFSNFNLFRIQVTNKMEKVFPKEEGGEGSKKGGSIEEFHQVSGLKVENL